MPSWLWIVGLVIGLSALAVFLAACAYVLYIICKYLSTVMRIFEERPLFLFKRSEPPNLDTQEVRFPTTDGLSLAGSYLRAPTPERRGLVLFAPEYGASRWSCVDYCGPLLKAGYDLFTFDFRNHGDSDKQEGYEPFQWVTGKEVDDVEAAVAYLKQRFDAPAEGVGFFGVSRGGGAGIVAASRDPWVKCLATDGAFGTLSTMIAYMLKWVSIYTRYHGFLPGWGYKVLAFLTLRRVAQRRGCTFPRIEGAARRLGGRPLFMVHGGADSYIKPEIAEKLYKAARADKELWFVPKAKHNQAHNVAGDEYHRRLGAFFAKHLAPQPAAVPAEAKPRVAVGV
jgi:pimeloyl-ACP methyl ester carboxylesterase